MISFSPLPKLYDSKRLAANLQVSLPNRIVGRIQGVARNVLQATGLPVPVGSVVEIRVRNRKPVRGQVVGFRGPETLLSTYDPADGIAPGDLVYFLTAESRVRVGRSLLGQVVDSAGMPLQLDSESQDQCFASKEPSKGTELLPLEAAPPCASRRTPVEKILHTGVRAVDSMLTVGRGQRLGVFAGAGVGKTRLLGMLARGTNADVVVVGLIGERGREVQEFVQRELDQATRAKCITVVATSDQSPLRRVQAANTCTTMAEYFRDQGQHVLLLMDSVTRYALAQREIGLAAGEPPATRGFPPSVFSALPKLVERAGVGQVQDGQTAAGTITGLYSVLVEGDDPNEPVSDTLRGLLDGHIVLSRRLAQEGHYPAIDVLSSLSRSQIDLVDEQHLELATKLRSLLAVLRQNEDLVSVGAYQEGTNPRLDQALAQGDLIKRFLRQADGDVANWHETLESLAELCGS